MELWKSRNFIAEVQKRVGKISLRYLKGVSEYLQQNVSNASILLSILFLYMVIKQTCSITKALLSLFENIPTTSMWQVLFFFFHAWKSNTRQSNNVILLIHKRITLACMPCVPMFWTRVKYGFSTWTTPLISIYGSSADWLLVILYRKSTLSSSWWKNSQ